MEATLLNLFLSKKESLQKELLNLELPQDMEKLESIINNIFVKDVQLEEYKRNLTKQELALLDAVFSMIDVSALLSKALHKEYTSPKMQIPVVIKNENVLQKFINSPLGSFVVGGATVGGIGSVIWNACKIPCLGLGSILCSIIGGVTAYYALSMKDSGVQISNESKGLFEPVYTLDVNVLMETIEELCASVDKSMSVFRDSISYNENVILENHKKDIVKDYSYLIDSLGELFVHSQKSDSSNLNDSIALVFRTLQNYHIQFKLYSDEIQDDFVKTPSDRVAESVTTKPALYNNGKLIESGECFIPIEELI